MSLVAVTDVADEIPGLDFNGVGESNHEIDATQVEGYITAVEAEIKARVAGGGLAWPAAGTDAALALRTLLLDGSVARTLSALYALSSADQTPASVDRVARRYADGLRALPQLLAGIEHEAPLTAGRSRPGIRRPHSRPHDYQDLEDFTRRRDPVSGYPWGDWRWHYR